jgi:hypothetical protein
MKAVYSSETFLTTYKNTRSHCTEYQNLKSARNKNLISHVLIMMPEVIAAGNIQSVIFWAMTQYSFVGCSQPFRRKYCLHIRGIQNLKRSQRWRFQLHHRVVLRSLPTFRWNIILPPSVLQDLKFSEAETHIVTLWVVPLCSFLIGCHLFRRTYHLHLEDTLVGTRLYGVVIQKTTIRIAFYLLKK